MLKGLDKVNKENNYMENVVLKTMASTGEPVGATIKASSFNCNESSENNYDFDLEDLCDPDSIECLSSMFIEDQGVMIIDRDYSGKTPAAVDFDMLKYTGFKNTDAIQNRLWFGHSREDIISKNFLISIGGHFRILWMPKVLKDDIGKKLNDLVENETGIKDYTDMICDETIAISQLEINEFWKEKGIQHSRWILLFKCFYYRRLQNLCGVGGVEIF